MNGFNRSYMYRSTETEKKGRKVRNHREDACRCFPPFVKFHYYDCPAVLKPCPIHGNLLYHAEKQQKVAREQNVIISFHPSTKTEKLLQPIKSLLAHCNSETKINFQYYSPENSKESVKPQNGQNAYESLKKSLNNNMFVEKTKSFVANKTNKVKKLKQCFHSPCNSIAQKTRSQTSIKEKLNQILREEAKQTRDVFYNLVPEIPPDDQKFDPTSKWFSPDRESLKRREFLSDEKSDSDFITVTQQDKTNTIHHKIFEIKHRKGLNDVPFVGFPQQQTHLVYSTVNATNGPVKENGCDCNDQKRINFDKTVPEEVEETGKSLDPCPSEKTNRSIASSSSGSVYITPFIFVPKGMEDSDAESKPKVKQTDVVEVGVQVEDQQPPKQMATPKQTETSITSKKSTVSQPAGKLINHEESKCHSVLLQTDSFLYQEKICHSSRHLYEPQSTSRVEQIFVGSHERAVMTRNYDDESSRQSKRSEMSRRTIDSTQQTKTAEMQTCSCSTFVKTPDSGRYTKTTEIQTCSGSTFVKTPDSGRYTKTTEIQTCSGSTFVKTPDSGRYTKTTEIQTCSNTISLRTPDSARYTRTIEVQPGRITPRTEVLIQARWGTTDKTSQTEDLWNLQVSVKTFDSDTSKSQGSEAHSTTTRVAFSNKGIQTSFYDNSSAESEFIELSSPELTYVIKPFEQQESDQAVDKLAKRWWGKSHSDSDLCERLKCACCKLDGENGYMQSELSKNFEMNNTPEKSPITKVYETGAGAENCPTVGNITVRKKETVQRFSDSKQTCTREEELSAAVSDLSELKKIIQEFFEKGNANSSKTCECCRSLTKEAKVDATTMTDASILPPKQENKKTFVDSGGEREKKNKDVQTALDRKEAETQVEEAKKNDTEAQTNVKVLLEEAEQQKADSQKIKLCQTVIIDKANQSKTFFVCAVCGRDVKQTLTSDVATNTSAYPERPKLTPVGGQYTESFEVKMITKKVQSGDNSKVSKGNSPMISDFRKQDDSSRPESSHKTKIPVPSHSGFVHFKKNESTTVQRATEIPAPVLSQHRSTTSRGSHKVSIPCERECVCEEVAAGPSTSKQGQTPQKESNAKQTKSDAPRTESMEVQTSRGSHKGRRRSKRNSKEEYYHPVLVTHFWPKELMKTWKSMEGGLSDIPSSDDSKPQTTKQKSSGKDSKKMKIDTISEEFLPELSDLFKQIWSSNIISYPPKTQEEKKNTTDEETVKKLPRSLGETPLEIDEDFLQDGLDFSDSTNTENSFSGDEEAEEEEEEEVRQTIERHNIQAPKLKPQSHSAVTFSTTPSPEDPTASKSLNTFLIIINPKKHKMFRRKRSK